MIVTLIDGTYELYRAHYGAPSSKLADGREIGATRALLRSLAGFLPQPGNGHAAIAFDTRIESFRNDLFPGYKTGAGIDPDLFAQFPLIERATRALGLVTWSMLEYEADDALATAAARFAQDPRVAQVRIASPDKDLCQCVRGERVVLLDRKSGKLTDEAGVHARLGVGPRSVAPFLALVGDAADGIPGVPRWGEKSAAAVLCRYPTLAEIPRDAAAWDVKVRGAQALVESLRNAEREVVLYETLATLRTDVPLAESLDDLTFRGVDADAFAALCDELGDPRLLQRMQHVRGAPPAKPQVPSS